MTELRQLMDKCVVSLSPPTDFSFPFPPYSIQKQFMTNLYQAIEEKKLCIFESPTGTGKSLSIICGALAWLKDHERRVVEELEAALKSLDLEGDSSAKDGKQATDWVAAQSKAMANESLKQVLRFKLDKIKRQEEKMKNVRKRHKLREPKIILKRETLPKTDNNEANDVKILLQEDDDDMLLEEPDPLNDGDSDEEDVKEEDDPPVKIIFCSRTHSQLSQFIGEIKRTVYAEDMRVVPLASRQNYCINKEVMRLKNVSLMNEKCLEMQKSKDKATALDDGKVVKKAKKSGACPYMKGSASLTDTIVSQVSDMETIVANGEKTKACPYYAARAAVPDSQILVVPYNTLLHKGTREACGLKIQNAVVIVDEAHNLLETVAHIHSTQLTGRQLTYANSQLTQYREKYDKRFSASNLLHLNQLIYIVSAMIKLLGGKSDSDPNENVSGLTDTKLMSVPDFLISATLDTLNLFEIIKFCRVSKITQKLQGFAERYHPVVKTRQPPAQKVSGMKAFLNDISNKTQAKNSKLQQQEMKTTEIREEEAEGQPLIHVVAFLQNLTQDYKDGRIILSSQSTVGKGSFKYLLLDPTSVLADVVAKARSVILAGGTMQPFAEFRERLFLACGAPESRIHEFSCDHVIPKNNILPIVLETGPTGKPLDFSFQARGSTQILSELGRILSNLCTVVPGGLVCFFPSYDYEKEVYEFLDKNGVIATIGSKKKLFREPKKNSEVEAVLGNYAQAVLNSTDGAILFSVVGGKLSEGLNFSDDLGRCVVVIGMPYANIKSPALLEKMNFLNQNVGPRAGRQFYENSCMKAVNQCIGRAIRHRNDFASVLLLDRRYTGQNVLSLLPKWISSSIQVHSKFGPVASSLVKFFKLHSTKK